MTVGEPGEDRMRQPAPRQRRTEKHQDTRRRLFAAAIKVAGKYGYAGASVARITAEAGVAQGTFYLHFENRQALLEQLLPAVGEAIVAAVRARSDRIFSEADREVERFRGFFDVLAEMPEFFRIVNEAELFAPESYRAYFDDIVRAYVKALKRGCDGENGFDDDELEVVARMLLGARSCLGKRYANPELGEPAPGYVFSAYEKLVRRGVFAKPAQTAS